MIKMKRPVYRVIDANFNRAREGLRVCEEFARFFLNDKNLTRDIKRTRNRITRLYYNFSDNKKALFLSRDTRHDVGKKGFLFERKRSGVRDVFYANIQRSKEALRVLEEFAKLVNQGMSDDFRILRFRIYEIEAKVVKRL